MKIIFDILQFELTRRCNQTCAHCCRGECQDVDLTKELIDAFFSNNIIRIRNLQFSGGEPTLNGELLEYIVDKIIEHDIEIDMFLIAINGLSYSESLVRGLNKLRDYIIAKSNYKRRCPGIIMVSQDQFHKPADPDVIKRLSELSFLEPIKRTVTEQKNILPYGRAYTNHLSLQEPNLLALIEYEKNYRVKEYEGEEYLIINYQYVASNGNIINDGLQSYDLMDKYALGNVRTSKIEDIYLHNQVKILKEHKKILNLN